MDDCVVCSIAATTFTTTYNDLDSVRAIFEANKGEFAGVILEPIVGNPGFIPPTQEFLEVRVLQQGWHVLCLSRQPTQTLVCA